MELIQLRQLVVIAEKKVLSHAAEKLNISQPALTRSIQRLEDELGLLLFDRTKNSMTLNKNGEIVVEQAKKVLSEVEFLMQKVESLKSDFPVIAIATCAPAPQWKLSAELSEKFPKLKITTTMPDEDDIVSLLLSEKVTLAIVRKKIDSESIETIPFMDEQLFMQIPLSDPLAKKKKIRFADLPDIFVFSGMSPGQFGGFDLAGKEIREYINTGFWYKVHREQIPDAHYIEYDDLMVYTNVIKSQNPLTFVTELGNTLRVKQEACVTLPIIDDEATAHYRLAYLKKNKNSLHEIISWAVKVDKDSPLE